ncbi:MAG: hypothetical protein HY711_05305 [Candidatus Melainabacteria bacterium]|nr:hypothetical protein [Candidatus Melainabacteria bacterium]
MILWMLGALCAVLVVSCLLIGWQAIFNYIPLLFSSDTVAINFDRPYMKMISFRGIFATYYSPTVGIFVGLFSTCAALALIAITWLKVGQDAVSKRWAFTITILAALLGSLHTYLYDSLLVAVCAALTMEEMSLSKACSEVDLYRKLWFVMLFFYPALTCIVLFLGSDQVRSLSLFCLHFILLLLAILNFRQIMSNR